MRTLLLLAAVLLAAPLSQAYDSGVAANPTDPVIESHVVLASGEKVFGDVRIELRSGLPASIMVDERSFDRREVIGYRMEGVDYAIAHNIGAQPVLLIKSVPGRASLYEELSYSTGADFFQIGDGPVQIASSANLRAAFVGNEAALSHLRREEQMGYVGYGAFAVGAALVGVGAYLELNNIEGTSGLMVAASGVAIAVAFNALVPVLQQQQRRAAIRTYNR